MGIAELYHLIYTQPLYRIIGCIAALIALWTVLRIFFSLGQTSARIWIWLNRVLAVCSVLGILLVTVFARSASESGISFALFRLPTEPGPRDEYPRMMLMNTLLFVPLGMSLGNSWSIRMKPWKQIAYTAIGGFSVSLLCELLQLVFSRGMLEADDLLMNTSGVLLGFSHAVLAGLLTDAVRLLIRKSKTRHD